MKIREKTSIDVLKEIFCLKWDKELAPILGCTTQAVSCARQRDRLFARMLAQAAKKCGMTRQQLKDFLPAQSRTVEDLPKQELREELRRCREEIWKLKEENRRLIEENGKLRLGA